MYVWSIGGVSIDDGSLAGWVMAESLLIFFGHDIHMHCI